MPEPKLYVCPAHNCAYAGPQCPACALLTRTNSGPPTRPKAAALGVRPMTADEMKMRDELLAHDPEDDGCRPLSDWEINFLYSLRTRDTISTYQADALGKTWLSVFGDKP